MTFLGKLFDNMGEKTKKIWIAVLIGLALLLVGSLFFDGSASKKSEDTSTVINETRRLQEEELRKTEERLEDILSKLQGAGRVQVMLTSRSSSSLVMAQDEKSDTQQQSDGTSSSESAAVEKNHMLVKNGSNQQTPLVIKEYEPEIEGVFVLCEGAQDPQVKSAVYNAVKSLLNVSPANIEVGVYDAGK